MLGKSKSVFRANFGPQSRTGCCWRRTFPVWSSEPHELLLAQDVHAACTAIPECDMFVYYPKGKSFSDKPRWGPSAILKTARDPNNATKLL